MLPTSTCARVDAMPDRNGLLTQAEQDKITAWFNVHWKLQSCPICGSSPLDKKFRSAGCDRRRGRTDVGRIWVSTDFSYVSSVRLYASFQRSKNGGISTRCATAPTAPIANKLLNKLRRLTWPFNLQVKTKFYLSSPIKGDRRALETVYVGRTVKVLYVFLRRSRHAGATFYGVYFSGASAAFSLAMGILINKVFTPIYLLRHKQLQFWNFRCWELFLFSVFTHGI